MKGPDLYSVCPEGVTFGADDADNSNIEHDGGDVFVLIIQKSDRPFRVILRESSCHYGN